MTQTTFDMFLNNIHGGPCPACGNQGELLRDQGTHGPGATRTLSHLNLDGFFQKCTLNTDAGMLFVKDGRWWFESTDNSERGKP